MIRRTMGRTDRGRTTTEQTGTDGQRTDNDDGTDIQDGRTEDDDGDDGTGTTERADDIFSLKVSDTTPGPQF